MTEYGYNAHLQPRSGSRTEAVLKLIRGGRDPLPPKPDPAPYVLPLLLAPPEPRETPKVTQAKGPGKRLAVLSLINQHPISRQHLQDKLGMVRDSIQYHIKWLRTRGMVVRVGSSNHDVLYDITDKGQVLLKELEEEANRGD